MSDFNVVSASVSGKDLSDGKGVYPLAGGSGADGLNSYVPKVFLESHFSTYIDLGQPVHWPRGQIFFAFLFLSQS